MDIYPASTLGQFPGRPERLTIYGASDYATMEPKKGKKEPDYTEHGIFGLDMNHELWALDWWSGQYETDKTVAAFIKLVKLWKPIMWFNEGGTIDKAIGPIIRSAMLQHRAHVHIESIPSLQDKGQKLQSFHALAGAGGAHFPINRAWSTGKNGVIEQLVKFPAGRWDDKADVCGLVARGIDMMVNPHAPMPVIREKLQPFTQAWIEYGEKRTPKVRYI